ncbi:MAG: amidinotransferase [Deltaproteobacteria bacterium]|nr:amidinotransferase [Deltaproteobacteria bacterium]
MSLKDSPQYYHEVLKLIPPRPTPVFEAEEMQTRVWGRRWGVYNDVGLLKMVMVHRPGAEVNRITADQYDPKLEAIIDKEEQWYWRRMEPPDLVKMQAEHDAMVEALRNEGAEVINMAECSPRDPKAMFVRDNAVALNGGALISRMGPAGEKPGTGRRGEEFYVMRKLVALGMPILRTIHGNGLFEGGSFAYIDEETAIIGMSFRQNESAAGQIEEVLAVQGVKLVRVPLTGHSLHLDGAFTMIDHNMAVVNSARLPYWFLDLLKERKIHTIEVHHADHYMITNCLAVRPGRVLLAINNGEGTAERMIKAGIEVVPIDYAECQCNGGSIHCSTLPLIRERD